MYLQNLTASYGKQIYYTDSFILSVISSKKYLVDSGNITARIVKDTIAYKYAGDFYGLLDYLNVPKQHHVVCMILNGLQSSGDYDGINTNILIYNQDSLDMIATVVSSIEITN
jgi:hypothetical protein